MPAPLRLKQSTGWFAAGQEVATALEILSDAAFKLYLYLCLYADRHTGRMALDGPEAARVMRGGNETVEDSLEELCRHQVCTRRQQGDRLMVEICDRFWPYERVPEIEATGDSSHYIQQVRQMLLAPACVRCSFTAADERLAANFHQRGVTLEQVQRAIGLGCLRKYVALLNGQMLMPVTSLQYFSAIVDEVRDTKVGNDYWSYVRASVAKLERRWIETRGGLATSPATANDFNRKTK